MHRSVLLVACLLTAGCLGAGSPSTATTHPATMSTLESTPMTTVSEPQACDGGLERLDSGVGSTPLQNRTAGFALAVDASEVPRGDSLTVSLRNVADTSQVTGTDRRYLIQRRVGEQWLSVLATPDGEAAWNATAVQHAPGSGFEWTFAANATGFAANRYGVCGAVPAGIYRFVYLGVSDEETRRPLAVRFRVGG